MVILKRVTARERLVMVIAEMDFQRVRPYSPAMLLEFFISH